MYRRDDVWHFEGSTEFHTTRSLSSEGKVSGLLPFSVFHFIQVSCKITHREVEADYLELFRWISVCDVFKDYIDACNVSASTYSGNFRALAGSDWYAAYLLLVRIEWGRTHDGCPRFP